MKLGDIIEAKPFESSKAMPGQVVYIHPRYRWYALEFTVGGFKKGKYRECFFMPSKSLIGKYRGGYHRPK